MSAHSGANFAASIVSLHEQILGTHSLINRAKKAAELLSGYELMSRVFEVYRSVRVLPFDEVARHRFEQLRDGKIKVGTMDLRIASIALVNGLTLLTRNHSDFSKIPDLSIEDWTK